MLAYQLIRSTKRKTIGLQVKHGEVIVRAPHFVKEQIITTLVENKTAWLKSKIAEQQNSPTEKAPSYAPQSLIYIFGQVKKIEVNYTDKASIHNTDSTLTINIAKRLQTKCVDNEQLIAQIKKQFDVWCKQQVNHYINTYLVNFCEQISLFPHSFKVKRYKSRWGSCNSKKELSFSSLLAMVPPWVIDYVIVHELCHLKHMDHSAKFWSLVTQHYPHYKEAKQWLKQHQTKLQW